MCVSNILSHITFLLMAPFMWKHTFHSYMITSWVLGCVLCLRSYISFYLLAWNFGSFFFHFKLRSHQNLFLYLLRGHGDVFSLSFCHKNYRYSVVSMVQINTFGDQCKSQNILIWPLTWLLGEKNYKYRISSYKLPFGKRHLHLWRGFTLWATSTRKKAAHRDFKRTQQDSFAHFTLGSVTASPPPLLSRAQDDTQAFNPLNFILCEWR